MVAWKKKSPDEKSPGKKIPGEKQSPERSPEKWSPEKCLQKIVLRQKNARKFYRLFYFYRLIPLQTQNDV